MVAFERFHDNWMGSIISWTDIRVINHLELPSLSLAGIATGNIRSDASIK